MWNSLQSITFLSGNSGSRCMPLLTRSFWRIFVFHCAVLTQWQPCVKAKQKGIYSSEYFDISPYGFTRLCWSTSGRYHNRPARLKDWELGNNGRFKTLQKYKTDSFGIFWWVRLGFTHNFCWFYKKTRRETFNPLLCRRLWSTCIVPCTVIRVFPHPVTHKRQLPGSC